MRILVVTPTFLPIIGGAETGIYEIYKRLTGRHKIEILTPYLPVRDIKIQGASDLAYYDENIFEVQRFYDLATLGKSKLKQLWMPFLPPVSFSYVASVLKAIARFKPDVVNMHYLFPGALALRAIRRFTNVPVLLSLVSRTDVLHGENVLYKWHPRFIKKTLSRASAITALTPYMMGSIGEEFNIGIIPYGVDVKRFSGAEQSADIRKRLDLSPDTKLLFTLQRLQKVKRVDFLVQSFSYLVEQGQNVALVIGGKGPEEENLKRQVDGLGIADRVSFTGYISEKALPEYFSTADLFLFSSASETFGIVLAQALAAGKPVVALDSTCVAEVIKHDYNGIILNVDYPARFASAVEELLDNEEKYAAFAANARATAVEKYNWDVISSRYEKLLQGLVSGSLTTNTGSTDEAKPQKAR